MIGFDEWLASLPPVLADRPHVVYIAWAGDQPLYAGMTADLERRLRAHRTSSDWAGDITHVDFVEVPDRASAERLERQVISDLRPEANRWRPSLRNAVGLSTDDLAAGDADAAAVAMFGRSA